ncbi:hypothetical protein AWN90_25490 [Nocardia terpenica]|uniref:Uncharacterized protein n=1 Tax=Nocardia terpenica TaxID=455432 RepID=A0A164NJH7_9NOCA|nr:hypothetical protein AWN90_25490 [Nocardia terpenica]
MAGWRLPVAWFTVSLLATVGLWRLLLARQEKPPEVPLFGGLMLTQLGLVLLVVPVVLSDAARSPSVRGTSRYPTDPLGSISRWIRTARYPLTEADFRPDRHDPPGYAESWYPGAPIWPGGLAFDLLLAALAFGITARQTARGRRR